VSGVSSSRQPPPSPLSAKRGLCRRHESDDDDDNHVLEVEAAVDGDSKDADSGDATVLFLETVSEAAAVDVVVVVVVVDFSALSFLLRP